MLKWELLDLKSMILYTLSSDPSLEDIRQINNVLKSFDSCVDLFSFKEYFYDNIYQESYDEQDIIHYLEELLK